MNCNVTDPISSNQVVEVGLMKPRCATFNGNTLNDWIKWLTEKQCEIDWTSFDLSELQIFLEEKLPDVNLQTQKSVIQVILDSIIMLKDSDIAEETKIVSTINGWSVTQTVKTVRKGSLVNLRGIVSGGNVANSFCVLDQSCWPAYTIKFPIYQENTYSTSYKVFVQITSNGIVSLSFTGSTPSITNSQSIFLDGISYIV